MFNIVGYAPSSFIDWPKRISSVIFIGGCNYRCPTCQNMDIVLDPGPFLELEDVIKEIKKISKWVDGIVLTGAEPLRHISIVNLVKILSEFKDVKVDTNGSDFDAILRVFPYVSLFSIDIKGPWRLYPELTGYRTNPALVEHTFQKIFDLAVKYPNKFLFRTTKVPILTDEDIEEVRSYLPPMFSLVLQEYRNSESFKNLKGE